MRPRAEIVCVGTELLSGKPNTHVAALAPLLRGAGLDVPRSETVADTIEEVRDAVAGALRRSDVVLVCGGLGPTFDDLTREAAAEALGRRLSYRQDLYRLIRRKYFRHRLRIPENNKRQAWVLEGARVLPNREGSAPGQLLRLGGRAGKTVALLPGPWSELRPMFESSVLPGLRRRHGAGLCQVRRVWRFCGLAEAAADQRLLPLIRAPGPGVELTILASPGLVDLHAAVTRSDASSARAALAALDRRVVRLLGSRLYGRDRDTLESVLGEWLRALGLSLATAESCTGGLLSQRITSVPGSSDYFAGGIVAYRNGVKSSCLGVREATLRRRGAVSEECARELASGACLALDADVGISITGIAGPGGATSVKPVGLVYIGIARKGGVRARRFLFRGDRLQIRERAANAALMMALETLRRRV